MRKGIAKWLRRVAEEIDPKDPTDLELDAMAAVLKAEGFKSTMQRYDLKRGWCYNLLKRKHPDARGRDISMAIEKAVQETLK